MKQYTNSPRKPMMYGGESRMKRMSGSPPAGEAPVARQKMDDKKEMEIRAGGKTLTEAQVQDQMREDLRRNNTDDELRKIAAGNDKDAMMARDILKKEGKLERRTGPKESSGMMYGGKTK